MLRNGSGAARLQMERLLQITGITNEKTEGIRPTPSATRCMIRRIGPGSEFIDNCTSTSTRLRKNNEEPEALMNQSVHTVTVLWPRQVLSLFATAHRNAQRALVSYALKGGKIWGMSLSFPWLCFVRVCCHHASAYCQAK